MESAEALFVLRALVLLHCARAVAFTHCSCGHHAGVMLGLCRHHVGLCKHLTGVGAVSGQPWHHLVLFQNAGVMSVMVGHHVGNASVLAS